MGLGMEKREDVSGYSIDSRTLQPGDLFFALKGDVHDGHKFVADAARAWRSRSFRSGRSRPGSTIDPGGGHIAGAAAACAQGVRAMGWQGGWGNGERRENDDEGRNRSHPGFFYARRQDSRELQQPCRPAAVDASYSEGG